MHADRRALLCISLHPGLPICLDYCNDGREQQLRLHPTRTLLPANYCTAMLHLMLLLQPITSCSSSPFQVAETSML